MDVSQAPCHNCPHVRYDHVDWKKGTSYEGNHTGCRIVGCGCQSFDDAMTVMLTMREPGDCWTKKK
jgi:hypothetical protein